MSFPEYGEIWALILLMAHIIGQVTGCAFLAKIFTKKSDLELGLFHWVCFCLSLISVGSLLDIAGISLVIPAVMLTHSLSALGWMTILSRLVQGKFSHRPIKPSYLALASIFPFFL